MKKLLYTIAVFIILSVITGCNSKAEDVWKEYKEYREENVAFYNEQAALLDENGEHFYTKIVPSWNLGAEILIHYFNDRKETEGNLSPMITSSCAISYRGRLYNDVAFDSSYTSTSNVMIFRPEETIVGWWVALEQMRVGDSVRVVIPYGLGYGSTGSLTGTISPYSTLVFDMKLQDIVAYEIMP